jgi:hypothetical protein
MWLDIAIGCAAWVGLCAAFAAGKCLLRRRHNKTQQHRPVIVIIDKEN